MIQRDYLTDPAAIYRRSFELLRAEARLDDIPPSLLPMVERVIHGSGMPDIVDDLRWWGDPAEAARRALKDGAPIVADSRMVVAGIIERRLPRECRILCRIAEPETARLARRLGTTRSAAAIEASRGALAGAVVVIGNAPTALFRLLEVMAEPDGPRAAAILAFPVGFVGAAESKEALVRRAAHVPYLTLLGRLGGSAMAASAVNAIFGDER